MAILVGMPDADYIFETTTAMSAYDVNATVQGVRVQDGSTAEVEGTGLFYWSKESVAAVDGSVVFAANGGGRWLEYFSGTGYNYIMIDPETNVITGNSLANITNADIAANAAIAFSKLAALPSAQILVGSAGNVPTAVAVSGDIAITNGGVASIAAGAVVNADVNASAAIDFSKLATLASANILVGSAGGVATSVAMSGDATISNVGALTIANNAVTTVKINDAAVTLAKLAPGITPAAIVVAAGTGSYAGGAATATFTIAGMQNTDTLVVSKITAANASVVQNVTHSGTTASVLLDTDPGASTFAYVLTRAAA